MADILPFLASVMNASAKFDSLEDSMRNSLLRRNMLTMISLVSLVSMTALVNAGALRADDRANDEDRLHNSGQVMKEIVDVPDNIPQGLLDKSACVVVIPSVLKAA